MEHSTELRAESGLMSEIFLNPKPPIIPIAAVPSVQCPILAPTA